MFEKFTYDVFISYSSQDKAIIHPLAERLRGGYVIGQRDIDEYLKGRGYAGHVNTSAKQENDTGCAELRDLIAKHIPWDRLPSTSTTKLFKALLDARSEFQDMERLPLADEKILLPAMLQTFLDRSLCYRVETPDGVRLVFPAYFKFERPTNPEQPQPRLQHSRRGWPHLSSHPHQ